MKALATKKYLKNISRGEPRTLVSDFLFRLLVADLDLAVELVRVLLRSGDHDEQVPATASMFVFFY
jgi:hypothetical protein